MTGQVPSNDMRVADHDRAAVVDDLDRALAEGRLDADEHDERTERARAAVTYGDLTTLVADLPVNRNASWGTLALNTEPMDPPDSSTSDETGAVRSDDDHTPMWRSPIAAGFSITMLNVVVWLVLAVNQGFDDVYPWWIWIALVWGGATVPSEIIRMRRSARQRSLPPPEQQERGTRDG